MYRCLVSYVELGWDSKAHVDGLLRYMVFSRLVDPDGFAPVYLLLKVSPAGVGKF